MVVIVPDDGFYRLICRKKDEFHRFTVTNTVSGVNRVSMVRVGIRVSVSFRVNLVHWG